jgi:hypothetical protein
MITTVLTSQSILRAKKIQLRNEQYLTHRSKHDHNADYSSNHRVFDEDKKYSSYLQFEQDL